MKFLRCFTFVGAAVISLLVPAPAPAATSSLAGNAINFNGLNNFVSVPLTAPPASNYTVTAWVLLRTGGTLGGTRMAVLSSAACGGSIELLIRSETASPTDPQHLELGRCGAFNGVSSTIQVPLNAWTHVAATVASNKTVSYFINGNPAGSWSGGGVDFSFGPVVELGANTASRRFDGELDEVQIWNRALSPAEILANRNRILTGNETGLYACYHFDEGKGVTVSNSATAGGGGAGALINNPLRVPSGVTLVPPASILYVGADQNIGSGWRTASVSKPHDVDGNNVLGTDGYHLVNLPATLPSYVGSTAILTSTYPGNANYASIDDPTKTDSLFLTGTMNPSPESGQAVDLFKFTLNTNAMGRTIRVGLLVDNLDGAGWNAHSLEMVQAYGNEASSGFLLTTSAALNNRLPDWLFFDIVGGTEGDTFIIRGTAGNYGAATLGGVAFDSSTFQLFPGTLNVALGISQQSIAFQTVSTKTNIAGTKTNITQSIKSAFTNDTLNSTDLLKLVENSFNITFPTGAKLNNFLGRFYVVDQTGTNVLLSLSPTLSGNFGDENSINSTILKITTTIKNGATTQSANDVENHGDTINLSYDDSTLNTADGTHSVFHLQGRSTDLISVSGTNATGTFSMTFKVTGDGTWRGKFTIFKGTISNTLKVSQFF
jgi:hypothetical protein